MTLPLPARLAKNVWAAIWRCFADERLAVHPSAVAFHLLACIVPFLLVLVAALGFFFSDWTARLAVSSFFVKLLPGSDVWTKDVIGKMIDPLIEHRKPALIAGVSLLLVTGSALMASLRMTLNDVFEVFQSRRAIYRKAYFMAVLGLIGATLFLGIALVWGFSVIAPHAIELLGLSDKPAKAITDTVVFVLLAGTNFGLFYGLYQFLPDKPPRARVALLAALFCVIMLEAGRRVSGFLLARSFENYNIVYGAYAILALTAVWLYYAALLFTACAAVARAIEETFNPPRHPA